MYGHALFRAVLDHVPYGTFGSPDDFCLGEFEERDAGGDIKRDASRSLPQ